MISPRGKLCLNVGAINHAITAILLRQLQRDNLKMSGTNLMVKYTVSRKRKKTIKY